MNALSLSHLGRVEHWKIETEIKFIFELILSWIEKPLHPIFQLGPRTLDDKKLLNSRTIPFVIRCSEGGTKAAESPTRERIGQVVKDLKSRRGGNPVLTVAHLKPNHIGSTPTVIVQLKTLEIAKCACLPINFCCINRGMLPSLTKDGVMELRR